MGFNKVMLGVGEKASISVGVNVQDEAYLAC